MKTRVRAFIASCLAAAVLGCGGASSGGASGTPPDGAAAAVLDPALFHVEGASSDIAEVACTLEDGSDATCYQLSFGSNPVANGPYCPETLAGVGGLGIYDGATDPGFQALKATLFEAMEADGYDIVETDGKIRIQDPGSEVPTPGFSYCLEATADDALTLTFTVPAVPKDRPTPDPVTTIDLIGVSLDGVPIAGPPPSVTKSDGVFGGGSGNIPALDACGATSTRPGITTGTSSPSR